MGMRSEAGDHAFLSAYRLDAAEETVDIPLGALLGDGRSVEVTLYTRPTPLQEAAFRLLDLDPARVQ
jgi:hypothetical protein